MNTKLLQRSLADLLELVIEEAPIDRYSFRTLIEGIKELFPLKESQYRRLLRKYDAESHAGQRETAREDTQLSIVRENNKLRAKNIKLVREQAKELGSMFEQLQEETKKVKQLEAQLVQWKTGVSLRVIKRRVIGESNSSSSSRTRSKR